MPELPAGDQVGRAHGPPRRHHCGDWGLVPPSDHAQNNENISQEGMLHSSYKTRNDTVIWVITEWDRSVTKVLLPSDY